MRGENRRDERLSQPSIEPELPGHAMDTISINPLPHMPILDSSNSAANKDMMSKILTNGDTIF